MAETLKELFRLIISGEVPLLSGEDLHYLVFVIRCGINKDGLESGVCEDFDELVITNSVAV